MKKFLEILEKRWWQGVGGIAGIIALVLVILQLIGVVNISWLGVSIVLNVIFAIILALVTIRATKWKRKYKDVSDRLEKSEKITQPLMEKPERQMILLPDPNYIWNLNIDSASLTDMYGKAHGRAVAQFHDAKLVRMAILVYPYREDKVSIHFNFYSPWANRRCTYIVSEVGEMRKSAPDKPGKQEEVTFDELPWLRDPNWLQFLKKSYEKVEPLSPATWSHYQIYADASLQPQWGVSFEDGLTGRESSFSWDGKGDPVLKE